MDVISRQQPQSTLNPNAPMFVPSAYRTVEVFSAEWWALVQSSPWFSDYWLQENFQDPQNDPFFSDISFSSFQQRQHGIVDIAFGQIARWFGVIEEVVGMELLEPRAFPHVHAWTNSFKEVPAIKENLPDHDRMVAFFKTFRENLLASS